MAYQSENRFLMFKNNGLVLSEFKVVVEANYERERKGVKYGVEVSSIGLYSGQLGIEEFSLGDKTWKTENLAKKSARMAIDLGAIGCEDANKFVEMVKAAVSEGVPEALEKMLCTSI